MAEQALADIDYNGAPSVLLFADSEAGQAKGREAVALAGCRVGAADEIEEALARLDRQVSFDAAFVALDRDHGEALDGLLTRLQSDAEAGRGSVVAAAPELIDRVWALAPHARVQHLCEEDETERALALQVATERPRHFLHDIGREQAPSRLQQLSEEARKVATALERLAAEDVRNEHAPSPETAPIDAGAVRAIIRARRLRDQFFGPDLFADPAWDILLDLYAARLEKQRVAVSSLCIAAAVPATTALRWIKTLTDLGLLVRAADPQDGRRVYIELSAEAADGLKAYLAAARRISPLNL